MKLIREVLNTLIRIKDYLKMYDVIKGASRFDYEKGHPLNCIPRSLRKRVENALDMILRPDPGAVGGVNICPMYNPDITTYQKLCSAL